MTVQIMDLWQCFEIGAGNGCSAQKIESASVYERLNRYMASCDNYKQASRSVLDELNAHPQGVVTPKIKSLMRLLDYLCAASLQDTNSV